MRTPDTNKIHQEPLDTEFGANAKLLEDKLAEVNWRRMARYYFIALGLVCAGLFGIVFSVGFALWIFR